MTLPKRIAKAPKRASRWRSQAHCNFVRSHGCCACAATTAIEVAHVRLGSGAGMGQRPHDFRTISLCKEHHAEQHRIGEQSFEKRYNIDMAGLADEFASASPRAIEIRSFRDGLT